MSEASPAELQRRLGEEFGSQGSRYDLTVGREIVGEIEGSGRVDPQALARKVSGTWLERNRATREDVAAAIDRAVGNLTPKVGEPVATVLNIYDNSFRLNMGPGAAITGENVSIGAGALINIQPGVDRNEVLAGVAALVRAGLTGDWDADAGRALARALEERNDIEYTDVEEVTAEVVTKEAQTKERGRDFMNKVAASGLGGALSHGIIAGVSQVLPLLA